MMFSVLVPVYNVEKYLSQCIESIIKQTEQDYELILVNDGSKDSSGRICDEYKSRFLDRIKVIHQENKGALLARRAAILEAKGEYCIFVDSDDYIKEDALEVIRKTIIENKADLVIYNLIKVTDESRQEKRTPTFFDRKIFTEENKHELYEKILHDESLNNLVLQAAKNEIIDKNSHCYADRYLNYAEDLLQTLPIVTNARRIIYINEYLYFYRLNLSSSTNSFDLQWYDSVKYVHKRLRCYMKMWKLDNEYGTSLLRQRYLLLIIQSIRKLMLPYCTLSLSERRKYIEKLVNDEFIDAYDNVKHKCKSLKWHIVLALLRKGKISIVLFITYGRRLILRHIMNKIN